MTPYLSDPDVTLYQGDAIDTLRELPDASVHMACTSPPFFGLRDYQAEGQIGLESSPDEWAARLVDVFRALRRVLRDDGTLWVECGDSYAASMTTDRRMHQPTGPDGTPAVTRESVATGQRTATNGLKPKDLIGQPWLLAFALRADGWYLRSCIVWSKPNAMPESVTDRPTTGHSYVFLFSKKPRYFYDAEALREPAEWARWGDQTVPKHDGTPTASGWIQPKSKDELTKLRSYDDEKRARGEFGAKTMGARIDGLQAKNARTVWTIPTEPNALAICRVCDAYWQGGAPREHCDEPVVQHFAAFPRELVRRMILAGTSERGVCGECGAPWVRELTKEATGRIRDRATGGLGAEYRRETHGLAAVKGQFQEGVVYKTTGWNPSCECKGDSDASPPIDDEGERRTGSPDFGSGLVRASVGDPDDLGGGRSNQAVSGAFVPGCDCRSPGHEGLDQPGIFEFVQAPVPATVLDPFSGSGTTLLVARQLGRHAIGVELNERYCAMSKARLRQLSLFAETSA